MLSRRRFIETAISAAGTVAVNGCTRSFAETSQVSPHLTNIPEVTTVKLGLLPLLDAAPLIIAKEKGLLSKYGMTGVELVQYDSWQTLQSHIALEEPFGISGAQMPSSLPYLIMAGKTVDGAQARMSILARLNVNGQSIAVANIYQNLSLRSDSSTLKESVERAKAGGPGMKLKIAIPCLGGTHDLWLRYWLAAGDINPDTDVSMVVGSTRSDGCQHGNRNRSCILCG